MMSFTRATAAVAVFTIGAFGIFGGIANAADLDQITISAPKVRIVARDYATGAPVEQATATGRIQVDPVTLTTNSGVALLNDAVQEAAQQLCDSLDPLNSDGGECVRGAVKSAQAQITAAVARAKA
jgi:UrcA family protein